MAALLMVLGVLGLFASKSIVSVLAAISVLVFAIWLDGGFDSILGVCG